MKIVKTTDILFYLLIIFLPTQLSRHFWPPFSFISGLRVDYLAPTIYLTDLLILGILVSWIVNKFKYQSSPTLQSESDQKRRTNIKKNSKFKIQKKWVLLVLFFGINVIFAQNTLLAFFKSLKIAELIFLAVYIVKEKPSFRITVYCLLFTVFYSSLIAWLQFYKQGSLGGLWWFLGERTFTVSTPGIARIGLFGRLLLRPYATFPHPNVLAGYVVTFIPLFISIPKNRLMKLLSIPIAILMIATIAITFSRTAWIALFLMGFIYLQRKIANKIVIIITIIGIGIASWFALPIINHTILFSAESFTVRNELMRAAVAMWRDHPIFGVGLNNFLSVLPTYVHINNFQSLQPVHNIFFLLLTETGITGILLFLLTVYFIKDQIISKFKFLISNQIPNPKSQSGQLEIRLIDNLLISLSSILFLSLFDHYFFTLQQTQLLGAMIIGFLLRSDVKNKL